MYKNYEIVEKRYIEDLNSEGVILRHIKTKAMVTLLLNDDENKVFYIGFRTPPKNSTGVAHILEHSTLCGSKNFPVKDPFIELAKGSLNTFLNAMTYPDKTVYPVASCNDKDFHNLMNIYLDAVFYPNIYKEDKIFKQEGWHYELENEDDELKINGVVYNEMKGVYSSPDDVVETQIMKSLYPDNTYGLVSGGDPKDIPDLSYEEFLDFHRQYYHPSNSYIYLYGNLNAEEYLEYIDKEYLSNFDYLYVDSQIKKQIPFEYVRHINKEYPVLDENSNDGVYLTYNVCMKDALDQKLYVALDVLNYVLAGAPGALIKQALLDANIGDDVYSEVEGGIYQPYFSIVAKGARLDQKDEFVRIIEDKLKEAVSNGISRKSLLASINELEFKYRESDFGSYPRGLIIGLQALDSWLYDNEKPFLHIEANATYEYLKNAINDGYFEKLIDKYMIKNNHKTVLTVEPKAGLTAKEDNDLKEKLKAYKEKLSHEQIINIINETKQLKEYQSTPSPKEDLEKIPMLSMEDLKKEAVKLVNNIDAINDTKLIYHNIFTNKISYINYLFNVKNIPNELIPYIGLLKGVLGLVDTKNYSYKDLFDEVNMVTGGLRFSYLAYPDKDDVNKYEPYFNIKVKLLYDKTKEALKLISEILFNSKLDDIKRLKEIINEQRSRLESVFMETGHVVSSSRAFSYFTEYAMLDDMINGIGYLRFIQDISDNFDEKCSDIVNKLNELSKYIFRKENLILDYTGTDEGLDLYKEHLNCLFDNLYTESVNAEKIKLNVEKKNEGFKTAGQVQYVCLAGNFKSKDLEYTGALRVLKVILGYDYLWNNIRVLGGAYGVMNGFSTNGNAYFVSYRDPNLENTIKVFKDAYEYIENLELDDRTILQYIIGTLSDVDIPFTPSTKGAYSLKCYLMNITDDDVQKERDQILGVTKEVINGLGQYIKACMDYDCLCVVGNADKLNEAKDLFDNIHDLI